MKFKAAAISILAAILIGNIAIGTIIVKELAYQNDLAYITAWETTDTVRAINETAGTNEGTNRTAAKIRVWLMENDTERYRKLIEK